jgi:hypothetical protein
MTRSPLTILAGASLVLSVSLSLGCGGPKKPSSLGGGDGGSTSGSGTGGSGGTGGPGTGGSGVPGGGTGGDGGGSGSAGTGGTGVNDGGLLPGAGDGGPTSIGDIFRILDGGLPDGSIRSLLPQCPANPQGATCGQGGQPGQCLITLDAGAVRGYCVCSNGQYQCVTPFDRDGGASSDGGPLGTLQACPAGTTAGGTCTSGGALCSQQADAGRGICFCSSDMRWRCL